MSGRTSPAAPGARTEPTLAQRIHGCVLGGAVGDALGAPVEFWSLGRIRDQLGPDGVTAYLPAFGRLGAITDDTQMALFTAEGLIRAQGRRRAVGRDEDVEVLWRAYQRWLSTQGEHVPWDQRFIGQPTGWLVAERFLHDRRAPGLTCLGGLSSPRMGTVEDPLNASDGCGGVMRMAPVGLVASDPFTLGVAAAATSHGGAGGYLPAGALALLVHWLVEGEALPRAARRAIRAVEGALSGSEVAGALWQAVRLASADVDPALAIEELGEGWDGTSALAIALFCSLRAPDFRSGVLAAVNHSGDSDSTGAITGNILGAAWGIEAIDEDLLIPLEGLGTMRRLADDLTAVARGTFEADGDRYPPW